MADLYIARLVSVNRLMMGLVHVVIMTNKEFTTKVLDICWDESYSRTTARHAIEKLVMENLPAKDCCKYMHVNYYSGRDLLYNHCPKCGRKLPKHPTHEVK